MLLDLDSELRTEKTKIFSTQFLCLILDGSQAFGLRWWAKNIGK